MSYSYWTKKNYLDEILFLILVFLFLFRSKFFSGSRWFSGEKRNEKKKENSPKYVNSKSIKISHIVENNMYNYSFSWKIVDPMILDESLFKDKDAFSTYREKFGMMKGFANTIVSDYVDAETKKNELHSKYVAIKIDKVTIFSHYQNE